MIAKVPFPIHLFDLPPLAVIRVIAGCRCPKADLDRVRELLRSDPSLAHIRIDQAVQNERHFRVDIPPLPGSQS